MLAAALKLNVQALPPLAEAASAAPIAVVFAINTLPALLSQMPPVFADGKIKRSSAEALPLICTASLPPFQSASPLGSLMLMPAATATGVCSMKLVVPPALNAGGALSMMVRVAVRVAVFCKTETPPLPSLVAAKSACLSPLKSPNTAVRGVAPVA